MRLLLIENHAAFASVVKAQFLSDQDVTVAPSLEAARAHVAAGPWDAVLVDYDLDDGKGDVLVRELRAAGFSRRIVGISSHEAGNAALQAAGADATCPKLQFGRVRAVLGV